MSVYFYISMYIYMYCFNVFVYSVQFGVVLDSYWVILYSLCCLIFQVLNMFLNAGRRKLGSEDVHVRDAFRLFHVCMLDFVVWSHYFTCVELFSVIRLWFYYDFNYNILVIYFNKQGYFEENTWNLYVSTLINFVWCFACMWDLHHRCTVYVIFKFGTWHQLYHTHNY